MTPSTQPFPFLLTLWVWPSGLYPNRCIQYLKTKRLPADILEKIRVVPEVLDTAGIHPINGLEGRPAGCSLPCLAVRHSDRPNEEPYLVTQASAILEFLEDVLPASQGYRSVRGGDAFETGMARDMVNLWSEINICANFTARHSYESTLMWSGMTREQQSVGAAQDARNELRRRVAVLERWCERTLGRGDGQWLCGTTEPSIADVTVGSSVLYMRKMYSDLDMLEGCPLLSGWLERYQESEFYAGPEDIAALEKGESRKWAWVARG